MDAYIYVVLAALVAIIGVVIGAQVQKTCRFIIPKDFLTVFMIIALVVLAVLGPLELTQWIVPYLLGYFAGYLVVGRTTYTMCVELPDPTHLRVRHRVIYEDSGHMYVQEQRNAALFDRLVFGIQHEVLTDTPLDDDKVLSYRRPIYPEWQNRAIFIDQLYTTMEVREGRLLKHKVYTDHLRAAYGSTVSKVQLMYDISVLEQMQMQIIDLTADVHRLESETGPKMLEHAMQLDMAAKRTTPENRALALAKALAANGGKIPELKHDHQETNTADAEQNEQKAQQ